MFDCHYGRVPVLGVIKNCWLTGHGWAGTMPSGKEYRVAVYGEKAEIPPYLPIADDRRGVFGVYLIERASDRAARTARREERAARTARRKAAA